MRAIRFKECNAVYAKDQPEYLQLPAHKTVGGIVTSCWKLSFRELIWILLTGKVYLKMMTFGRPLQPLKMSVKKPLNSLGKDL